MTPQIYIATDRGVDIVEPEDVSIEAFDQSVQAVIDQNPDAEVDWAYGNLYNPNKS